MPKADPLIDPLVIGGHIVPGIWRYMLPYDFLNLKFPEERSASCMNCPRIITDNYRPDYRCCTYFPKVPNYMIGLSYKHDKDSRKILNKVKGQGFFLPDGMTESARMYADFVTQVSKEEFGQGESTLCPFINKENGYCGIYHYRNAVCSTFFCKNDNGDNGQKFWDEVTTLVMQIELSLAQWALEQIGYDYKAFIKRMNTLGPRIKETFDAETRTWKKATLKYIWGKEYGNEMQIYAKCAEVIRKNRDDLWEITNNIHVFETEQYDKGANKLVPKEHRDEIGQVNTDDDVTVPPRNIYNDLTNKHKKLWEVPKHKLMLNPRVQMFKNPKDDEESKSFANKPFELAFMKRQGGTNPEWRSFINKNDVEVLKMFASPLSPSFDIMKKIEKLTSGKPETFVSEYVGQKVLIKAR